jgi:ureidoglycolate lyase
MLADERAYAIQTLAVQTLTAENFAPFGAVISPKLDGVEFGPDDAQLDLTGGKPRFYCMIVASRGLLVTQIARHRHVTQALASCGGQEWLLAVAPPGEAEEPALEAIRAFRIPGDVALMLHKGAWRAGPLFAAGERSFFNLELCDTNIVDHHTCKLISRYGVALKPE